MARVSPFDALVFKTAADLLELSSDPIEGNLRKQRTIFSVFSNTSLVCGWWTGSSLPTLPLSFSPPERLLYSSRGRVHFLGEDA